MSAHWRLRADLHKDGIARALKEHLGDSRLFCYTGTQQRAQEAKCLIHSLAARDGWPIDARLERWHPSREEWPAPGSGP